MSHSFGLWLGEADAWLRRAELTVRAEAEPMAALAVQYIRGQLELARGRAASARVGWRLGVVNLGAAGWLLSLG